MPRAIDPETVERLADEAGELIGQVVGSHAKSTVRLVHEACRRGADVRLTYDFATATVSISLVHPNGASNVLFSAQAGDHDFGFEAIGSTLGKV